MKNKLSGFHLNLFRHFVKINNEAELASINVKLNEIYLLGGYIDGEQNLNYI